ncbi:MAG: histidinol-phosphate transaminase [Mariprofundales bacterium]|nr:histidinol-phosphate transaminase [Mariprofundales bacterium]
MSGQLHSPAPCWLDQAVVQSRRLHPYTPGKPVEQLLRELGIKHGVKLASNENPFGPSPLAQAAIINSATQVHRYPDGNATELKEALAAKHGVGVDQLLLGNGSNEVLELVIRTFAAAGDNVIYSRRGFIVYSLAAIAAGADGRAVAEVDGLSHDLDGMVAAIDERTKVLCIANPNNPTGTIHSLAQLQSALDRIPPHIVVIVDEAYVEFVIDTLGESIGSLHHPGLVICRTLSKAYGLAGLRVGYAVADAELIDVVNRFREPFNLNLVAQHAALAALADGEWVRDKVKQVIRERSRVECELRSMGLLHSPCHGNFVLIRHPLAAELVRKMERQGFILRPLTPYGMSESVRLTVGLPQEMSALLHALHSFVAG